MDTLYIVKDDGETEMIGEITECDINSDEMKEQGYQYLFDNTEEVNFALTNPRKHWPRPLMKMAFQGKKLIEQWENNTIMMHCNDGKVIDIRETNNPAYTFGNIAENNWGVVDR